jgi:hypothetical protein
VVKLLQGPVILPREGNVLREKEYIVLAVQSCVVGVGISARYPCSGERKRKPTKTLLCKRCFKHRGICRECSVQESGSHVYIPRLRPASNFNLNYQAVVKLNWFARGQEFLFIANMQNDKGEVVDIYQPRKWCVLAHP